MMGKMGQTQVEFFEQGVLRKAHSHDKSEEECLEQEGPGHVMVLHFREEHGSVPVRCSNKHNSCITCCFRVDHPVHARVRRTRRGTGAKSRTHRN